MTSWQVPHGVDAADPPDDWRTRRRGSPSAWRLAGGRDGGSGRDAQRCDPDKRRLQLRNEIHKASSQGEYRTAGEERGGRSGVWSATLGPRLTALSFGREQGYKTVRPRPVNSTCVNAVAWAPLPARRLSQPFGAVRRTAHARCRSAWPSSSVPRRRSPPSRRAAVRPTRVSTAVHIDGCARQPPGLRTAVRSASRAVQASCPADRGGTGVQHRRSEPVVVGAPADCLQPLSKRLWTSRAGWSSAVVRVLPGPKDAVGAWG